jgi:Fe2+ or Zn2+ uptake regulation protein
MIEKKTSSSPRMTEFRLKVLRAIEAQPGAGSLNLCDDLNRWENVDILNVRKAMAWLDENGFTLNGDLTEKANLLLKEVTP